MYLEPPLTRELEWITRDKPLPSKHPIWPRTPPLKLLTVLLLLSLHRSTPVSHLFQFQFSFQLIGCYLLWFRYEIESKLVGEFALTLGSSTPQSGSDHYPLPFIDLMHGSFKEHVVGDVPLHALEDVPLHAFGLSEA